MPDPNGITPAPDNAPVTEPVAPVEPGASQDYQEPQAPYGGQPGIPEKFAGKSPEEIVQSYQELERKMHEQAEELANLRRQPSPPYPPYPPPGYPYGAPIQPSPPPQPEIRMNWENPVETIAQVVNQTIKPMVANYQQNTAKSLGEVAFQNAKSADPALFNGVENETKAFMLNMIDNGILAPDSALNPQTWAMAAWQMQGMKTGYKGRSPSGPPINPVAPVRTEIPGARPPYQGPPLPAMNDADRRMMDKMGITEEQFRKNYSGRR